MESKLENNSLENQQEKNNDAEKQQESKYKLFRPFEDDDLILTENGVKINGIFFKDEGVQIIQLNSMDLLFVFNLKTKTLVRIVDLEYRTVFLTDVLMGDWTRMSRSADGKYIVVFCDASEQTEERHLKSKSVSIFILNFSNLLDKISATRKELDSQKQKETEKITEIENEHEVIITYKVPGVTEVLKTELEKYPEGKNAKILLLGKDDNGNLKTEQFKTGKNPDFDPPTQEKEIKTKVISKVDIIRMATRSSKFNIEVEEIKDALIQKEGWASNSTIKIFFLLERNPRTKKTKVQSLFRDYFNMIKHQDRFEEVIYKVITMECDGEHVDYMTEIKEDIWKDWIDQKQLTLRKQLYVQIMQQKFKNYKLITEMLDSKIKSENDNFKFFALIEPVVNEDGSIYDQDITGSKANFEIVFPNFYSNSILFFILKDDKITIEKITKEGENQGVVTYSKKYDTFEFGIKQLEKLLK